MKNNNTQCDKSMPYRTLSMNVIKAPTKPKNEPKSTVIKYKQDLRVKRSAK